MLRSLLRAMRGGRPDAATSLREAERFFSPSDLPLPALPSLRDALVAACAFAAGGHDAQAHKALARIPRGSGLALPDALAGYLHERGGNADAAEHSFAAARAGADAEGLALHLINRGRGHLNANAVIAARHCLLVAARLEPAVALPLEMLGFAGYLCGDIDSGRRCYDQALERVDDGARRALEINRLINTIPQIAPSSTALARARAEFDAELARLAGAPARIDDPLADINRTAFFLAYQGVDDRASSAALAEMFLGSCPALAYEAAHARVRTPVGARPARVGFVSMNLGAQSVGVWYRRYIGEMIAGGRIDATLITYGDDVDPALREAAERHGRHVQIGPTLADARARIEEARLDLIIYTDVGMHPFMYFLAMSRLAPRQALLVGHPATSGIPAIDFFLGNVFQDREDAQGQYSEKLVRLPLIPVYVEKTIAPAAPMTRAELGLADGVRYYVCPMMLQKMHPDFDWALAEILRRDPKGEVLLFADNARPLWQEQLETRFAATLGEGASRVAFRPFAPKREFDSLLMAADVVLDPFHFSGGVTTYIVLSLGCPLVTLPGEFFRGRMSAGMLAQAGLKDGIATSPAHYVELALRIAADAGEQQAIRARILAAHDRLFETRAALDALLDWIEETTGGAAAG